MEMTVELMEAASAVFSDYLRIEPGEDVLVIYDHTTTTIAEALSEAAKKQDIPLTLREIEPTGENGKDPDPETCSMMCQHKIVLAPTYYSLTHCAAVRTAKQMGTRVATLPGINEGIFTRGLKVDPMYLNRTGELWIEALEGDQQIRIVSDKGTNLSFNIGQYYVENDDGCIFEDGIVGNLPAGEVYIAPDPDSGNGTLVFDGSIAGQPWDENVEPAIFHLEHGYLVRAEGERAEALFNTLSAYGKPGLFLAEFGIGTNPHLKISGDLLEDEKVKGTVHLAFGNNCGFGGDNDVPVHIDGLVLRPDVFVGGKLLMKNGEWLIKDEQ